MMHGLRVLKIPMSIPIVLSFFDAIYDQGFDNSDALLVKKSSHHLQSNPISGYYRLLHLQRPLAQNWIC